MSDYNPEEQGLSAFLVTAMADCPCCGEPIELVVDVSVPEQTYIEDCPVCCRPISVTTVAARGDLDSISVRAESE